MVDNWGSVKLTKSNVYKYPLKELSNLEMYKLMKKENKEFNFYKKECIIENKKFVEQK